MPNPKVFMRLLLSRAAPAVRPAVAAVLGLAAAFHLVDVVVAAGKAAL